MRKHTTNRRRDSDDYRNYQHMDIKRKKVEEACHFLSLEIRGAEGVDTPILHPKIPIHESKYCAVVRVGSSDQIYVTREIRRNVEEIEGMQVLGSLRWGDKFRIPLGKFLDPEELSVEIVRVDSWSDPGTSGGIVVVGRARIQIPNVLRSKKGGRFGLVRANGESCRGEGHIWMSMEVTRFIN